MINTQCLNKTENSNKKFPTSLLVKKANDMNDSYLKQVVKLEKEYELLNFNDKSVLDCLYFMKQCIYNSIDYLEITNNNALYSQIIEKLCKKPNNNSDNEFSLQLPNNTTISDLQNYNLSINAQKEKKIFNFNPTLKHEFLKKSTIIIIKFRAKHETQKSGLSSGLFI